MDSETEPDRLGIVYQISAFVADHPGGIDVLVECAGTDATETYDYAGHSEGAKETLGQFLVGELQGHVGDAAGKHAARDASKASGSVAAASSATRSRAGFHSLSGPFVGLILVTLAGILGTKIVRNMAAGYFETMGRSEWYAAWDGMTAFWTGVLVASSVTCLGLVYSYEVLSKTMQHTKEPFAYPAIIPRPVHVN